jgi:hypothetical protein
VSLREGACLILLARAQLACGGREIGAELQEAGTPSRAEVQELSDWYAQLGVAICAKAVRCEPELGPTYASERACLSMFNQDEPYGLYFFGVNGYEAREATLRDHTFAGDRARQACLSAIGASPCEQRFNEVDACASILIPHHTIAAGGACRQGDVVCAADFICRGSSERSCGVCGAPYADGHACEYDYDCQSRRCLPLPDGGYACGSKSLQHGPGEPCISNAGCRDNLLCSDGADPRCVAWARVGEPCVYASIPPCVRGAACSNEAAPSQGVCVALLADGAPCPRVRDSSRLCLNWCIFATPDAAEGTCGIAPAGPGPCAAYQADHSLFCPAGTYTDVPADAGPCPANCVCKALGQRGASCADHLQCADGPCRSGTCSAPDRATGDSCTQHVECISGYCDGQRCGDLPQLHCSG